jgi:hypothetical protein
VPLDVIRHCAHEGRPRQAFRAARRRA